MEQYKLRCAWCGNEKDSNDEWCSVRCYQEHKKNNPETFVQFELITKQKHKEREEKEKESAAFEKFWGKIIRVIFICIFGFCVVWLILAFVWEILTGIFRMLFG